MTKQEAINIKDEILKKEGSIYICNAITIDGVVLIKDILDIIDKHIAESKVIEPQSKWIPVSERLPEKNMACLLSISKFNFTKIGTYSDLMGTIDHKIFWIGEYGKNDFEDVTEYVRAWMPLPKRYIP